MENETVKQMALLFKTSRTNTVEHINNIYLEGELEKNSTCQNFRQVRKEANRKASIANRNRSKKCLAIDISKLYMRFAFFLI